MAHHSQRHEERRVAFEAKWVDKREDLIAALRGGGHDLFITTEWFTGEGGGAFKTKVICRICGESYRGVLLRGGWGLSAKRACHGRNVS